MAYKGCRTDLQEEFGNIYAGSVITDVLSGATTAVGAAEIGSTEIAAAGVATANIADSAVTSVKAALVSTGSPPTGGFIVQMGNSTLAAGSKWVAFPKSFVSAPEVMTQIKDPEDGLNYDVKFRVCPGSVDTGSFFAMGSDATTDFTWIAIGSGAF